jgi:phosphatidylserine/phosphatidylglycerophosphate/cardiolipin synthase-like enzyme
MLSTEILTMQNDKTQTRWSGLPAYKISACFSRLLILAVGAFLCLMLAMPAASAARGLTDENAADGRGCPVTLLRNKDYFFTLSQKIQEARKQIVMAFFLFKTNGHPESYPEIILKNLSRAMQRGVLVTVILERDDRPDSSVDRDNRATAERLQKMGVAVHFDAPKKTTHTKLAVIDERYTFIGSHNLTQSALKHNNELSVLIDSTDIAGKTLSYINGLYR